MPSTRIHDITQGVYGVLGSDIQYTLSPAIFRTVFTSLMWPAVYAVFDKRASQVARFAGAAFDAGVVGFNVTQPHKVRIIQHLHRLDATARAVGAVNTVLCDLRGGVGYNTDVDGVESALATYRKRLNGKTAVIIGAGGAARATAYTLANRFGMSEIVFAVRSVQRGRRVISELAGHCSRTALDAVVIDRLGTDIRFGHAALLVNATPAGSGSQRNRLPIPVRLSLSARPIVFDLVYRPRQTRFLQHARAAGCRVVDGWPMLIAQADAAFHIWTGGHFPRRVRTQLINWNPES